MQAFLIMHKILFLISVAAVGMISCSPARHFTKSQQTLLSDTALAGAHIGISIYDPAANKYIYNYQGDKYFVPASNTKLFTCYAAIKYLGDSLVGLRYEHSNTDVVTLVGTGDPTFLHPDFKNQPVFDFLKNEKKLSYLQDAFLTRFTPLGKGWSWEDYGEDYEVERSEMPIYGNVAKFYMQGDTVAVSPPAFFNNNFQHNNGTLRNGVGLWFKIVRPFEENAFHPLYVPSIFQSKTEFTSQLVPFKTISNPGSPFPKPTFVKLLEDTLHRKMSIGSYSDARFVPHHILHSQPTDSLLKPMMHRSDNFFAEQSLLMVSNEKLGYMNDKDIIDTLLKIDLNDLPQKPVWVDGSGLSRYNQFTPQDIVTLLLKIKNEFGLDRIRNILPKGNTGTLTGYYQKIGNNIFAKTGTLSGQVALSGYLICKSKKLLLFSVMVNNHNSTGRSVRRAVEKFVTGVWERN